MEAITLSEPWVSLVAIGVKGVEMRSWQTSCRGPLAIHSGRTAISRSLPSHLVGARSTGQTPRGEARHDVDGVVVHGRT